MATFKMDNAKINNAYMGDTINFYGNVNKTELESELEKLLKNIADPKEELPQSTVETAQANLKEAITQVRSEKPDRNILLECISNTKGLVEGINNSSWIIKALVDLAGTIKNLF